MKVLGYTEEVTNCDCCGRRNLRGTFGVETDGGDVLHYGSVCVNKAYGKKRGEAIKSEAKHLGPCLLTATRAASSPTISALTVRGVTLAITASPQWTQLQSSATGRRRKLSGSGRRKPHRHERPER